MFKTLRVKLISALAGRDVSVAINCDFVGQVHIPAGMICMVRDVKITAA